MAEAYAVEPDRHRVTRVICEMVIHLLKGGAAAQRSFLLSSDAEIDAAFAKMIGFVIRVLTR